MKHVGRNEVQVRCPECGKDKLNINTIKRIGQCWGCGHVVNGGSLPLFYDEIPDRKFTQLTRIPQLTKPEGRQDARDYLRSRNTDSHNPGYDNILWDDDQRRLYFRITSPAPEFQPSYHTRGIDYKTGWRVFPGTKKEHYVFGGPEGAPGGGKRVVLVEGIFDALAIRHGAMSILGTVLYPTIESYLCGKDFYGTVYLWMDPDDAGKKAERQIRKILDRRGVHMIPIHHNLEPSDCLQKHGRVCLERTLKRYERASWL